MPKPYLLALLLPALAACQREADVRPDNYDELALATGHWEWQGSSYQLGLRTPATEGYTRQLTFGPGSRLVLRRAGQPDYATTYQLAVGTPTLSYATHESHLGNNDTKTYAIARQQGHQVLTLVGEQVCVDGGAFETYYWVPE